VNSIDGRIVGVRVDGNVIPADIVVIAMGPWSYQAKEWFNIPKVEAIKAHSIVFRPKEPATPHALFLDFESKDGTRSDPEVYPRPDGTVYICGQTQYTAVPEDPATITPNEGACEKLIHVGKTISSILIDAEVERKQACFLPISPDDVPLIGVIPGIEGAYIATAHSCWGILNGPATGLCMAELISGQNTSVDLSNFSPKRFLKKK